MTLSYKTNYVQEQKNTYIKNFATFVSREMLYQLELELKGNHPLFYGVNSLFPIGKMFFLKWNKSY